MKLINIELDENFILKLIKDKINNAAKHDWQQETSFLNQLKYNRDFLNQLPTKKLGSSTFFEFLVGNSQYEWVKEIVFNPLIKSQIEEVFLETSKKRELQPLKKQLPNFLISLMQHQELALDKVVHPVFNSENWKDLYQLLSEILLNNNKYYNQHFTHMLNMKIKDDMKPLSFSLFNFFQFNPELVESTTNIEWGRFDDLGNTLCHNLLDYDMKLYEPVLKQMNKNNYWNLKNNKQETPLSVWVKTLNNKPDGFEKMTYLLKTHLIDWEEHTKDLLELIKRAINQYTSNAYKDSKEREEQFIQLYQEITQLPQYNGKKVQGLLNGFFNNPKTNTEKIKRVQSLVLKMNLENNLEQGVTKPKLKI